MEWDLVRGTWDETEAWVGREIGNYKGADEVTCADIRRRLEVLQFDCPLHWDEAIAQAYGYPTIVAPSTLLVSAALPAYWEPGSPATCDGALSLPALPITRVPAPGTRIFATRIETEYFKPLFPGDRVAATAKLVSVTRKKLSIGDGAFFVVETTYRKQTGEMAGTDRVTYFRYSPEEGKQRG